jgi:hypothetical protein
VSEAVPESSTCEGVGIPSEAGQALIREVHELWAAHGELLAEARRSEEEALAILAELGRRLSGEKERLARPGRSGGWSSFTRSAGLTRAEADGLVRRYRRTLRSQAACTVTAETVATPAGQPAAAVPEVYPEAPAQMAVSTPSTCPEPQPSGEAPAIAALPAAGIAAAPAGAGQAAEAAAGVSGGDVAPVQSGPGAAVADAGSPAVA